MNPIQQLRQDAIQKRDKAIAAARQEYSAAIRQIKLTERLLRDKPNGRPKHRYPAVKAKNQSLAKHTAIGAAEAVLRELGPLTLVEIVLEMRLRGCRTEDDPRAIMRSVQTSFRYHADRFVRDAKGRWSVMCK